jgi:putative spermidine/putrescine transport system substrate-binding protein
MKKQHRRVLGWSACALLVGALAITAAGCGSSKSSSGKTSSTGGSNLPTAIGKGEGKLNLIEWPGYAQATWRKPFETQTGCKIQLKDAGSSNQMVALMRTGGGGGGGQYDMVSASGDATLRLIYGGDVRPVNVNLIPGWKDFIQELKSPAHNTVKGVHYGVSLQWGPNTLLYNTQKVKPAPTSWASLYDPANKGKITVPGNPIQIADAALFLSKERPNLGIKDPYELTKQQFDAVVALLKEQKPLVKTYWGFASDEITAFKNGDVTMGAAWPYQTLTLQADKVPVKEIIPKEGATGWADTWMIAKKAKHPNCAYLWMKWVSTPKVQAQQALGFGETPANTKACPFMDKIQAGSCAKYHANAPEAYFKSIKFWKTPVADCGNGKKDCIDYGQWQSAWTQITG